MQINLNLFIVNVAEFTIVTLLLLLHLGGIEKKRIWLVDG